MADIIRKSLLTAIGTASIAAEKADKILRDIVKKGLINTKDARSLVKKLAKEAENSGKRVQKIISEELKKQAKKAKPIVRKGKAATKEVIFAAKKTIKEAQKAAEKKGKSIIKKAAKKLGR